jgi:23S rRNA (guanosine2251-2'-O)-methyltransferase
MKRDQPAGSPHRRTERGRSNRRGFEDPAHADDGPLLIFGSHAVEAALANPSRTIRTVWMTENAERRLADAISTRQLTVERVLPRELDRRLGPDTVHQGALIEVDPLPDVTLDDLADLAASGKPVVVLDQVTDPHNVGAVLRSAAAFGAAGLVLTRRHSPPLGSTLAKAASGALDVVPIALVGNLAQALASLKERFFQVVGLDGASDDRLEDQPAAELTAIVLGAEGKGLRQLTRETCDVVCRLHTDGPLASLNVSNAAAVALHHLALTRQRNGAP